MSTQVLTAADFLSFQGGIGRSRFWGLSCITALALIPAYIAILLTINRSSIIAFALVGFGMFTTFAVCIALVSLGVRRLHDRGKSGLWVALYYPALLLLTTVDYDGGGVAFIAVAAMISGLAVVDLGVLKGAEPRAISS
jgi:uncharacterized membrane protein YhaH (DUF805 family)